eukprot:3936911-Rhodomonas_salina.1
MIAACDPTTVPEQDQLSMVRLLAASSEDVLHVRPDGVDAIQAAEQIPNKMISCQVLDILEHARSFPSTPIRMSEALAHAIQAGYDLHAKMLIRHGAQLPVEMAARTVQGALQTAAGVRALLHCPQFSNNLDAVMRLSEPLSEAATEPEEVQGGKPALLHACERNSKGAVHELLAHKASPLALAEDGRSVLHTMYDLHRAEGGSQYSEVVQVLAGAAMRGAGAEGRRADARAVYMLLLTGLKSVEDLFGADYKFQEDALHSVLTLNFEGPYGFLVTYGHNAAARGVRRFGDRGKVLQLCGVYQSVCTGRMKGQVPLHCLCGCTSCRLVQATPKVFEDDNYPWRWDQKEEKRSYCLLLRLQSLREQLEQMD